jgi:poly-gamma-glutamate synthesis protein (capsule biosynthesis protein)
MKPNAREVLLAAIMLLLTRCTGFAAETTRFPPVAGEPELFIRALAKEQPAATGRLPVTGITVPHHLLAADLIARGFWAASGNAYDRIVVLSPDHFRRSHRPIATTERDFETVLGVVEVDKPAAKLLINRPDLVDDSDLFMHEHGITALLPFLHYVFPGTPVVPVALGIGTDQEDWDHAVQLLKQIVSPRTLVVQSTDYSHYLMPEIARARDQETLNVIAAGDATMVAGLQQPNHLDSKAAQYVQMRLQHEIFNSHAAVVANRNSFDYVQERTSSTSYVVTIYSTSDAALSTLVYADQQITHFGGDVFLGRWFTAPLLNREAQSAVIDGVRQLTAGQPLVINLEGVITATPPVGTPPTRHLMDEGLAGPILQAINVTTAGLANNHSFDLGRDGFIATEKTLKGRGIRPLPHMLVANLGAFRLVALNFVGAGDFKRYPVVRGTGPSARPFASSDLGRICRVPALPPLVALVHWGKEYTSIAGERERWIAETLAACGVSLVIGAHSHRASSRLEMIAGGESLMFFSLGNLLFDQRGPNGTGAIVELRVFKQGTFATRVVAVPNLYDAAVNRN